jgi:hypothetical protein
VATTNSDGGRSGFMVRSQLRKYRQTSAVITGFVNGDTAATAVTGAAALSTTATAASAVGTYPITAAAGTLAAKNYSFKFVNGTLTVTLIGTVATPTFTPEQGT